MERYMNDMSNQLIVEEVECFYQDVVLPIPEEDMADRMVNVSAEFLCCVSELLFALLATYEGRSTAVTVMVDDVYPAHVVH